MNEMAPSALLRMRGRAALRGKWQTAVMVVFFSGTLSILFTLALNTLFAKVDMNYLARLTPPAALDYISVIVKPHLWYLIPLMLANILVGPTLTMGMLRYFMDVQRGGSPGVSILFSRFSTLLKNFGLQLMLALLITLWSLLLVIPGGILLYFIPAAARITATSLLSWAILAGILAISYRYFLAQYIYLDDPDAKVMRSIRESKALMKGYVGSAFILTISFMGWTMLAYIPTLFIENSVVGYIISTFAMQFLNAYIISTQATFYMVRRGEKLVQIPSTETEEKGDGEQ